MRITTAMGAVVPKREHMAQIVMEYPPPPTRWQRFCAGLETAALYGGIGLLGAVNPAAFGVVLAMTLNGNRK